MLTDGLIGGEQLQRRSTQTIVVAGRVGAGSFADIDLEIQRGNFNRAIRKAERLLMSEPRSGLAYELIGTAHFAAGRFGEAMDAFRRATEVESGQSGPWTKLGTLQMESNMLSEAEASLTEAAKINERDRQAHQRLGMLYEYQKRIPEAIAHYEKGLEGTDPGYLGIAVSLGRLLNRTRNHAETVRVLAPRLALSNTNTEAQMVLASAYLTTGHPDRALERYQRAAALDPASDGARLGVAASQRALGEPESALLIINEILATRPEWVPALLQQGTTLLALGRESEAQKSFERLGALRGDGAYASKRMAQHYIDKGDKREAARYFDQLLASGEADPDGIVRYSELLLSIGETRKGETVLRQGVERFPENAYLRFRLGSYLAGLKQYQAALPELKRAAELAPKDPTVLSIYSRAQARAGETGGSAETAGILHELYPDRANYTLLYAIRLEADGRDRHAEKIYRQLLSDHPDSVIALNNLASILGQRGQYSEALPLARRATTLVNNNAQLLDTLGWILHQQGASQEALATLSRAVELDPDVAIIHYHLGAVLDDSGQKTGAQRALRKAISLDANGSWADDANARLARIN
jgi:tetratricopeptide (TPR) repeat protein